MLAMTDMLVVLLPLTDATRGIIDASLLGQLRQGGRLGGPVLINAGRGGLQVEADILAALDSGRLKGASLDVFEREPLPEDSRLWSHPAVYVSPHNASVSTPEAIAAFVAAPDRSARARRAAAPSRRSAARVLRRARYAQPRCRSGRSLTSSGCKSTAFCCYVWRVGMRPDSGSRVASRAKRICAV